MKRAGKFLGVLFCVVLIFSSLLPTKGFAAQPIRVTVNGRALAMETPPIIQGGRTLVPLRVIFESLGATVEWASQTRTITGRRNGRTVILQINNPLASIDGKMVTLDVPAIIWAGRTMVPTRFIAESLGAVVSWDQQTRNVSVETVGVVRATSINPRTQKQPLDPREVVALVQPATVRIETHRGVGSGFFVSSDGLVLTNAHVVRGSIGISITTSDGKRFPARILKINNRTDLALLKAETTPDSSFPIIKHKAYIKNVPVGDEVLAFGNPLGLAGTVTRGIVSAKRELSPSFGAWTPDILVVQHDAAIAQGSSGGPLVNLYGEWIGVNTMGITGAGFNFAVPSDSYYWLARQESYSLKDDWFSYYTEHYLWIKELSKIVPIINEAMATTLAQRKIELLNQSIPALRILYDEAASYQPLYPEIQNLHQLYLYRLDTGIAYASFILDVATGRALWSQSTNDTLWNNYLRAREAHVAELNRINELFR